MEIKEVRLLYDSKEFARWKSRDSSLVPEYFLNQGGRGVEQGYHYGEFFVYRYLREKGHEVVFPECFNLVDKRSKHDSNNKLIEAAMGKERYAAFRESIRKLVESGVKVENPDLCVLSPTLFFADVKKGNDFFRDSQKAFAEACVKHGFEFRVYFLKASP